MTTRRRLLTGFGALLVASPAIVRASSLMPVHAWKEPLVSRVIPNDPGLYRVLSVAKDAGGNFVHRMAGDRSVFEFALKYRLELGDVVHVVSLSPLPEPINFSKYDWQESRAS